MLNQQHVQTLFIMALLNATVVFVRNFEAKPAIEAKPATARTAAVEAQAAWPEKNTYKLMCKKVGGLKSETLHLTLLAADGVFKEGETFQFESEDYHTRLKETANGFIKIIEQKSLLETM
jgi:hypothetical protein